MSMFGSPSSRSGDSQSYEKASRRGGAHGSDERRREDRRRQEKRRRDSNIGARAATGARRNGGASLAGRPGRVCVRRGILSAPKPAVRGARTVPQGGRSAGALIMRIRRRAWRAIPTVIACEGERAYGPQRTRPLSLASTLSFAQRVLRRERSGSCHNRWTIVARIRGGRGEPVPGRSEPMSSPQSHPKNSIDRGVSVTG